ncbi:hypothetical protein SORBI_3005G198700 [Sorghum bicolor]|uniref:Uncharacterized protein n=1 Tax=Sorghum bicolor TaxID=4558 RepID=A0A1B6PTP0_SORBI|nr:hypothetical protein SORBI_3005G198700 [Sorghum bicolor]
MTVFKKCSHCLLALPSMPGQANCSSSSTKELQLYWYLSRLQSTTTHTPGDSDNNTPSIDQTTNTDTQITQTNKQAKRRLDFLPDDAATNDREEAQKLSEPQSHLHAPKRHKNIADSSPSPSI